MDIKHIQYTLNYEMIILYRLLPVGLLLLFFAFKILLVMYFDQGFAVYSPMISSLHYQVSHKWQHIRGYACLNNSTISLMCIISVTDYK